jgi:mannose-6-phosphate isomerase
MTTSTDRLYPYRLEPFEKPAIWGGHALVKRYGKHADPTAAIGESWECWDNNRVDNGALTGSTLGDLRATLGSELMGPIDTGRIFPLLTKIIDANLALSVQVHPDDAYAQRVERQHNGKTECWYILAAQPGAELVLGWTKDTDRGEYERRVADGSLGDILRHVPVRAGEAYYLPAGTLHAIGAGIVLFEAQQASDLTYRIFDWNRVDADGKPRELHVERAGDVLDFRASTRTAVATIGFVDNGLERTVLVAGPQFSLEHLRAQATATTFPTYGLPLTLTALATPLQVGVGSTHAEVAAYETIVVPAAAQAVSVSAGEMLVARPDSQVLQLRRDGQRAGIAAAQLDEFFGQFA